MIDAPVLPGGAEYLWRTFIDLHNASSGKIGYNEIVAYQQLTGCELTPTEVDMIIAMNREAHNG